MGRFSCGDERTPARSPLTFGSRRPTFRDSLPCLRDIAPGTRRTEARPGGISNPRGRRRRAGPRHRPLAPSPFWPLRHEVEPPYSWRTRARGVPHSARAVSPIVDENTRRSPEEWLNHAVYGAHLFSSASGRNSRSTGAGWWSGVGKRSRCSCAGDPLHVHRLRKPLLYPLSDGVFWLNQAVSAA